MKDETERVPTPDGGLPLLEVVKGLRDQPPLLFGIGAGIVLVAVLAATTSIVLVVVVAAVLVVALAAWMFRETRGSAAEGRRKARARVKHARITDDSDVGVVEGEVGPGTASVDVQGEGAEISRSRVGVVRTGPRRKRD
jgi:hypothetical protein